MGDSVRWPGRSQVYSGEGFESISRINASRSEGSQRPSNTGNPFQMTAVAQYSGFPHQLHLQQRQDANPLLEIFYPRAEMAHQATPITANVGYDASVPPLMKDAVSVVLRALRNLFPSSFADVHVTTQGLGHGNVGQTETPEEGVPGPTVMRLALLAPRPSATDPDGTSDLQGRYILTAAHEFILHALPNAIARDQGDALEECETQHSMIYTPADEYNVYVACLKEVLKQISNVNVQHAFLNEMCRDVAYHLNEDLDISNHEKTQAMQWIDSTAETLRQVQQGNASLLDFDSSRLLSEYAVFRSD